MKKLALIMSMMVCLLCFVGCKNDPVVENDDENNIQQEEPKVEEPSVGDGALDVPSVEEPKVEEPKPEEPKEEKTYDINEVMTNIITKAQAEVRMPMQEAIPVEVSYSFMGITEEDFNTYVTESIVYESMVSPANQSVCLIKINDSSKVEELKKSIIDNCNPRKWVCMSAEKAIVINSGNYILLAMAEEAKCDSIITAFTEEFGSAGEVLSKGGDL